MGRRRAAGAGPVIPREADSSEPGADSSASQGRMSADQRQGRGQGVLPMLPRGTPSLLLLPLFLLALLTSAPPPARAQPEERNVTAAAMALRAQQGQQIHSLMADIKRLRSTARAQELGITVEQVDSKVYEFGITHEENVSTWEQEANHPHLPAALLTFSAYRISDHNITILGLSRYTHRFYFRFQGCFWHSPDGTRREGTLSREKSYEHHEYTYEMIQLVCNFSESVVNDPAVGRFTTDGIYVSEGGTLEVWMNEEIFFPYSEPKGYTVLPSSYQGPFTYNMAYCGAPMFGDLVTESVVQWVAYHRFHAGYEKFQFYDSGSVQGGMWDALRPLVSDGLVVITDFREVLQYHSWAQSQSLAQHDCVFRYRETARWIAFGDFDEYLTATKVPLDQILIKYPDAASVTYGQYNYSVERCEGATAGGPDVDVWGKGSDQFAVERMLYRDPEPVCRFNHESEEQEVPQLCRRWLGHRKYFLNPRKVFWVLVHEVYIGDPGVDLHVDDLSAGHYRALFRPNKACSGTPAANLTKDSSVAAIAAYARRCERDGFRDMTKCSPPATGG